MVMFKMEEQEQNLVEDGEYVGELADVVEVNGKHGPCVRFVFNIVGGEVEGLQTSILVGQKLSPGNKLDNVLRALGVEPLEIGEQANTDSLIGRRARIYVEQSVNNATGKTYSNITKIKSLKTVVKTVHATPASQVPAAAVPAPTSQVPGTVVIPSAVPAQAPAETYVAQPPSPPAVPAAPVAPATTVRKTNTISF
jgi:hypothetical protein